MYFVNGAITPSYNREFCETWIRSNEFTVLSAAACMPIYLMSLCFAHVCLSLCIFYIQSINWSKSFRFGEPLLQISVKFDDQIKTYDNKVALCFKISIIYVIPEIDFENVISW